MRILISQLKSNIIFTPINKNEPLGNLYLVAHFLY